MRARGLLVFCLGLAFVAALAAAFFLHVPVALLVTCALGAACLVWGALVITLPWNLYFEARAVLTDMAASRERGINVALDREAEARTVARRMLGASVGLHLASSAGMAVVAASSGEQWAWWFAGFYLLSTAVRPAWEYHRYLLMRLRQLKQEVHYPRNDVLALVEDVMVLKRQSAEHEAEYREVFQMVRVLEAQTQARDAELDRKVTGVGRSLEETVNKLTDNQEIISGIKAFLRLVQTGPARQ
jgi:hypothetical protein